MRTVTNVLAVDFQTGKRLWQTDGRRRPKTPPMRLPPVSMPWRNNMSPPAQYGQRIWDDATYGTLSSDGRLVFVIEELPLGVSGGPYGVIDVRRRSQRSVESEHHQPACGLRHPYRQAVNGSWAARRRCSEPDTFFLGPPLPLRGQLYVMAEVKDEMRLLALDATTGKRLWSQQLAMVESNITQDPARRLAGVSPSYSDGVLICPTGAGCVVAVDLATRSLLWGYIYPRPGGSDRQWTPRTDESAPECLLQQFQRSRAPLA